MATGIVLDPSCEDTWNKMRIGHKFVFVTFKIFDDKEIVVDVTGAEAESFETFKQALPDNDCRYAFVEIPGTTKIVFILWAPDTAPVKSKLIYASTQAAISCRLSGFHRSVQANDWSDIEESKLRKFV